jgi:hypothetical protein
MKCGGTAGFGGLAQEELLTSGSVKQGAEAECTD